MKYRYIYIISILILIWLNSCQQDSFYYRGVSKINFTSNSLYFSFGEVPFSVEDTILKIPVEIMGYESNKERAFAIAIDKAKTTAKENKHYTPIDTQKLFIASNKSNSFIPINIYRLNLQQDSIYKLYLKIMPNENFDLGAIEYQNITIQFSNRIEYPEWWSMLSKWLGSFNVRKYQKFIELYGRPISKDDVIENKYGILRIFKEVKKFFEAHPEYDVIFPDVAWIV